MSAVGKILVDHLEHLVEQLFVEPTVEEAQEPVLVVAALAENLAHSAAAVHDGEKEVDAAFERGLDVLSFLEAGFQVVACAVALTQQYGVSIQVKSLDQRLWSPSLSNNNLYCIVVMDFKSRFKGKCSVMNKEGVIGIVKQPSNPVAKEKSPTYLSDYDYEPTPISSKTHATEVPKEFRQQVFTNIQASRNVPQQQNYSQKFQSYAQQMLYDQAQNAAYEKMKLSGDKPYQPLKYQQPLRYQEVDLEEYEWVAIPKKVLGQYSKDSLGVDRYSMTHSFAPARMDLKAPVTSTLTTNQTEDGHSNASALPAGHYKTPLIKTYSHNPQNWQTREQYGKIQPQKPPLLKNQSEKFSERKNKLLQAGLGSIRYNSYAKK